MSTLLGYLRLIRPANVLTAYADILAGFAIAGGTVKILDGTVTVKPESLLWLLLSTTGLYAGGIVLNDVSDADIDATERPERPIPAGTISFRGATVLSTLFLLGGATAALFVNPWSAGIAVLVVLLILLYDLGLKYVPVLGSIGMGLCRSGNLLLGVSIVPSAMFQYWYLLAFPFVYIWAVTFISEEEVRGGSALQGSVGIGVLLLILTGLGSLSFLDTFQLLHAAPFLFLLALLVLPAYWKAARNPEPSSMKNAVKRGVLSLVFLNATLAAGFGSLLLGAVTATIFPLSFLLGRCFSVT